jgi:hypothetical protein
LLSAVFIVSGFYCQWFLLSAAFIVSGFYRANRWPKTFLNFITLGSTTKTQ